MDIFFKLYKEACKKYADKGFKMIKQGCARIENDVVQMFYLKRWRGGHFCDIEFGVLPLCMYVHDIDIGRNTLSDFKFYPREWEYEPKSEDSIRQCIASIFNIIDNELMPFFERSTSCKTAFQETVNLEQHFHDVWLAYRDRIGADWGTRPIEELILGQIYGHLYYMALKNGNKEYAYAYLINLLNSHKDHLQNVSSLVPEGLVERRKYELTREIESINLQLAVVESGNFAMFEETLKHNELMSRQRLSELSKGKL